MPVDFFLLLNSYCASLRPVFGSLNTCKYLKVNYLKQHFKWREFSTNLWKNLWKTPAAGAKNQTNRRVYNTFHSLTQRIA